MKPFNNRNDKTLAPQASAAPLSWGLAHLLWMLTLVLIFMGALVKSHEAGLSVPDWPTTYGQNMFLFPYSEWRANVFYEHTHRLVAALVGVLTLLLFTVLLIRDKRTWVRACSAAALAIVVLQGVLGGLTVLYLLPAPVSAAHGVLAQSFLLLAVFLAYTFSHERGRRIRDDADRCAPSLALWSIFATAVVWIQLVLGAIVRHTESGLAIPDFPTMGGKWLPPFDAEMIEWINGWRIDHTFESGAFLPDVTLGQVAIHAAHRLFAIVVLVSVLRLIRVAWRARQLNPAAARSAVYVGVLLFIQIALGAATVLTAKQPLIASLHVAVGAAILALSWLCALEASPVELRLGTLPKTIIDPRTSRT